MSSYHNDQPITGSDTYPDRLNREKFATNLAKILTIDPSDECLTVSLEGEWGYGKTSVVNLLKKDTKSVLFILTLTFVGITIAYMIIYDLTEMERLGSVLVLISLVLASIGLGTTILNDRKNEISKTNS